MTKKKYIKEDESTTLEFETNISTYPNYSMRNTNRVKNHYIESHKVVQ